MERAKLLHVRAVGFVDRLDDYSGPETGSMGGNGTCVALDLDGRADLCRGIVFLDFFTARTRAKRCFFGDLDSGSHRAGSGFRVVIVLFGRRFSGCLSSGRDIACLSLGRHGMPGQS